MGDLASLRSASRHSWKVLVGPILIILITAYTFYGFATPTVSGLTGALSPLTSSLDDSPAGATPSSPSGDRYAAVIIETHLSDAVIPIILHFATVLPPWWSIVIFTLEEHWEMPLSSTFQRAVADKRVSVQFLPAGTSLSNSGSVSRFLTKPWIYEQVGWAERMLMFQADSIVCAQAETSVDDFAQFDYIGAPIDKRWGNGFNGGLSIRNPKLFMQITKESDFEASGDEFEDQWFYKQTLARVEQGVMLPEPDVAKLFAVETIYYDKPLGYHQPARWQAGNMPKIEKWCPEVKMLLSRRAT